MRTAWARLEQEARLCPGFPYVGFQLKSLYYWHNKTNIDNMEDIKLHKYCRRHAISVSESIKSKYYRFPGGIVLRVSDHYAQNSTGIFSIIKTSNPGQYIITAKVTGIVRVCNYKEVKSFVKSLSQVSGFLPWNEIINQGNVPTVGTLDISWLSKGQLEQVRSWYKQKFGEELKVVVN